MITEVQLKTSKLTYQSDWVNFIRGFSILTVILLHMNIRMPFSKSIFGEHMPHMLYNLFFWSGYYGVIMFFVVSGFLITTSTLNKWDSLQAVNPKQFYGFRAARILPCLLLIIVVLSALSLAHIQSYVLHKTSLLNAIFATLTFHINWIEAKDGYLPGPWGIFWSLSIEEAFYLAFPILCMLIKHEKILVGLLFIFVLVGPLARIGFFEAQANPIWVDHSYLSCIDGIVWGCYAALFVKKFSLPKQTARIVLFIGLACMTLILCFRGAVYQAGLTKTGLNVSILEVGTALTILVLYKTNIKNKFINFLTKVVRWFGTQSYEVYLIHMFIVLLAFQFFKYFHKPHYLLVVFYLLVISISAGLAALFSRFYSIPTNSKLRKLIT